MSESADQRVVQLETALRAVQGLLQGRLIAEGPIATRRVNEATALVNKALVGSTVDVQVLTAGQTKQLLEAWKELRGRVVGGGFDEDVEAMDEALTALENK